MGEEDLTYIHMRLCATLATQGIWRSILTWKERIHESSATAAIDNEIFVVFQLKLVSMCYSKDEK